MDKHYFAADGNYGSADGIILVNTRAFTKGQWQLIEESSDSERVSVVEEVLEENDSETVSKENLTISIDY